MRFNTATPGGRRQGRGVECPEVRDALETVVPGVAGVVEQFHDVGTPDQRAPRHAAGQDLCKTRKIGSDLV